jgi:hypothetical protein
VFFFLISWLLFVIAICYIPFTEAWVNFVLGYWVMLLSSCEKWNGL